MHLPASTLLSWSPRVIGLAFALFLSMFALDALEEGIVALLLHLTPTIVLLLVVAAAWRREWIGGAAFIACAVFFGAPAWVRGEPNLIITGPLLTVGFLFLWSWRHRKQASR